MQTISLTFLHFPHCFISPAPLAFVLALRSLVKYTMCAVYAQIDGSDNWHTKLRSIYLWTPKSRMLITYGAYLFKSVFALISLRMPVYATVDHHFQFKESSNLSINIGCTKYIGYTIINNKWNREGENADGRRTIAIFVRRDILVKTSDQ